MTRKIKNLLFAAVLFFAAVPAFAVEEYVSLVYKEIDVAFANRSDATLDEILQKYQGDDYYFLMENYSMKKVRRLIIINDYEFALDADLVIIDNNLDNTEAVELYATITDAYEMQKALQLLAEEKRQAEEIRIVNLKEEQRGIAAKQYNAVTTSSGNTVYTTGKDGGNFSNSGWNFDLGISPALISNTSDGLQSIVLGLGFDYGYYRILKSINIGGDVGGSFKFLNQPIKGADNSIFFDANLMLKVAFKGLSEKLFLRGGADVEGRLVGNSPYVSVADLQNTFVSPSLGIKLDNIPLGNLGFSLSSDWLMAHLWTPGLNFAMKVDTSLSVPFGTMEKFDLNFIVGLKDVFLMKETGIENRLNFILALGAKSVK